MIFLINFVSSDLELLIRQEQRTFSPSLIGHLEQLKEPLAKDKPLINRLNLIYHRGRNVLVAETRIHNGERLRELIYVSPESKLLTMILVDLHECNHHCMISTLMSLFQEHFATVKTQDCL